MLHPVPAPTYDIRNNTLNLKLTFKELITWQSHCYRAPDWIAENKEGGPCTYFFAMATTSSGNFQIFINLVTCQQYPNSDILGGGHIIKWFSVHIDCTTPQCTYLVEFFPHKCHEFIKIKLSHQIK